MFFQCRIAVLCKGSTQGNFLYRYVLYCFSFVWIFYIFLKLNISLWKIESDTTDSCQIEMQVKFTWQKRSSERLMFNYQRNRQFCMYTSSLTSLFFESVPMDTWSLKFFLRWFYHYAVSLIKELSKSLTCAHCLFRCLAF